MNGVTGGNERRRYPVSFALRYEMAAPEVARKGTGETVWMSGKEVAFIGKGPGGVGDKVVLHIDWPVLLQGHVPLQLTAAAELVQRSGPLCVVRLTKFEFRTRAVHSPVVRLPIPVWMTPRQAVTAASASGG